MIVVALTALVGGAFYGVHTIHASGEAQGIAETTVKWDADKAAIQAIADAAIAKATKARDDALSANEVTIDAYETKLLTANAGASQLAERLRNAYAHTAASGSSVPQTGGGSGAPGASGQASDDRLTQLLASAAAECAKNDDRLDALVTELKPQL